MGFPTTTDEQVPVIISNLLRVFTQNTRYYGTVWHVLSHQSLAEQILIKTRRIREIQEKKNHEAKSEIEEGLIGIANYSAMALVQIEKGSNGRREPDLEEAVSFVREQMRNAEDLMLKKNHDYGEAWREMRISSIVDLILMKLLRIKQIEGNKGKTLVSEGVDANYLDMINYAIFALIHIKDGKDSMK